VSEPNSPTEPPAPAGESAAGLGGSLRAAGRAALVAGTLFGLVDGIVAARIGTADLGPLELAGCLAATVCQYTLVAFAGLALTALVLHRRLARGPVADRARRLLVLALAVGIFVEIYWWSRELVFYGRSSLAPERLLVTAAIAAVACALAWIGGRTIARFGSGLQRALSLAGAILLAGGAVFLVAQSPGASSRGAIGERNRDLPNVVLVIVDALRQDVLGCYGNQEVKTPAIDALAAEGVVFENAFVQAPFTWTSFGSILTGKYPRRHGLVKMRPGVVMAPNVTLPVHLKSARREDGTLLTADDWVGGTFHTGTLSTGSRLLQGFDQYFEAMAGHDLVVLGNPWSVFRSDLLLYVFKNKLEQRFASNLLVTRACQWIGENAGRRFVTMIHLYSTHTPYDPPKRFQDLYVDRGYSGPIRSFYAQYREAIEDGRFVPTSADIAQIRALYHAGVSQADAEIGEVVEALGRAGILEDTLIVVTADHGESLGERNLWEHNHMVETNLRVPLVMRWPKRLPKGKRVPALTDEIDILPTICGVLGIEPPKFEDKYGKVDGTSLLPLVRGEKDSVRPFSFAENGHELSVQDLANKLVVAREIFTSDDPHAAWQLALAGKLPRPRFHDLASDPDELHPLDLASPRCLELFEALIAWDKSMPIPQNDISLSEREIEEQARQMNALGYTNAGIGGDDSDGAPSGPQSVPAKKRK
jgi:arylsulfatase A-like enzyme